jgi:hypothetical protein
MCWASHGMSRFRTSASNYPGWSLTCLLAPCVVLGSYAWGAEQSKTVARPAPSPNTLFLCVDAGQQIHTNTELNRNCKAVVLGPPPAQKTATEASAAPKEASKTPPGFPKIGEALQKARDVDRKRILDEELATEQKNLDLAKKELSRQESETLTEEKSYTKLVERLQPFREKVALHEQNIRALRKEIDATSK